MIVKNFEKVLAFYARTGSEMDQRTRGLRNFGLLPVTRGRHAPAISSQQAAYMVLSLVAARGGEAGPVAVAAAELNPIPRKDGAHSAYTARLVDFIASFLAEPGSAFNVGLRRIEIPETAEFAKALFKDGASILFSNDNRVRNELADFGNYDETGEFACSKRLCLSGGYLDQLAIELQVREPEGFEWS